MLYSCCGASGGAVFKFAGILPVHVDCHKFILDVQQQEFSMVHRALHIMRAVGYHTTRGQMFYAVWLVQTDKWDFNVNLQVENGFTLIAQVLTRFFEKDEDIFWIAKHLYEYVKKIEGDFPKLAEISVKLLQKEDPGLYKHLRRTRVLENLPVLKWFECCFAGILSEKALGK